MNTQNNIRDLDAREIDAVEGGLLFVLAVAPVVKFTVGVIIGAAAAGGAIYVAEQD